MPKSSNELQNLTKKYEVNNGTAKSGAGVSYAEAQKGHKISDGLKGLTEKYGVKVHDTIRTESRPYSQAIEKQTLPTIPEMQEPTIPYITDTAYNAKKTALQTQLNNIQMQGHTNQLAMEGYMTLEDRERLTAEKNTLQQQAADIQKQLDELERQNASARYSDAYNRMTEGTRNSTEQLGALMAERDKLFGTLGSGAIKQEDNDRILEIQGQIKATERMLAAEGFTKEEIESLSRQSLMNYNAAETKKLQESVYQKALDRTGAGNLLARTGTSLVSGVGAIDLAIQNMTAGTDAITGQRELVDYNTAWQRPQHRNVAVTEAHNENIVKKYNEKYGEGTKKAENAIKASTFANNIAASIGQSAAVVGLTALGVPGATLLLGGSAATATMHDFHKQGYTDGQALTMGLIAGAAETITEKIGIDNLFALKELKGLTGKALATAVWKNLRSQAMSEAGEEGLSSVMNTIAEVIVLGDESTFNREVEALVKQGMDRKAAQAQVLKSWALNLGSDMLAGGLSGMFFGAAQAPVSILSRNLDAEIAKEKTAETKGKGKNIEKATEKAAEAVAEQTAEQQQTPQMQQSEAQQGTQEATSAQQTENTQPQNVAQAGTQAEINTKKAAINMTEMGVENENISDAGQRNRNDGIGAGGPDGVFSAAAGRTYADERGNQREVRPGVGADPAAVVREVSAAELGITGGDATNRVQIIDPERVGGAVQTAANAVLNAGLEPVAVHGDLIVNGVSVNGWIENGKIYFRANAVDSRGNAVDPVKIVNHELFHEAVEGDPELVESAGEIVREKMTEAEFMAMRDAYKTAYGKVQDFTGWTEEEIEAYILQEIVADAYAGMNYFSNKAETTKTVRVAAQRVGQNQTDRSGTETRGSPVESETAPLEDGAITVDSTEEQRYEILKNKEIEPAEVDYDRLDDVQHEKLNGTQRSEAKSAIKEIARKLGIGNIDLQNSKILFVFHYSIKNVGISAQHQAEYGGTYQDFVKVLSCLGEAVRNAELIETHREKKTGTSKANEDLKQVYVLVSAVRDGKNVIPVQFEVKEFYKNDGRLYITAALTKIKESEVINKPTPGKTGAAAYLFSNSKVSIRKIFENVNADDKRFLKYVPDGFLNEEQKAAKKEALKNQREEYAAYKIDGRGSLTIGPELNRDEMTAKASVEVNPNPWREAERFSENWAAERARDKEIQELMEADPVGVLQEGIRITKTQLAAAKGDRFKKLQKRLKRLEQAVAYFAYAEETSKPVNTMEETQLVKDLRWSAERVIDNRGKRRTRNSEANDDSPKAMYTRGEWEAEQDRRSSYETEEAPPERESVYDEEAQAFADEWARERLEQQRESEYEEAVDQAKERVLSGKKGHMTGRDGVKKTVSIRQNNRGQWFGEIKTGKSTQDTRRYKTKEEAAEAVISKAETGDETGVNSSIPENPVNKEPRTVEETRRETDERVREKAEEVLGEDPVVNGREMSPLEEKEVKDMISEHGDMLDDDAEASAELAWATEIVSGKGGDYADTLGRNLDAAAGKNKALREKLHQLIEIPLRKAKESYAKGLGGKRNALYDEIVEGLGIKPGSKESAAVQWYGEGQRNTESGDRSVLEVGGRKISVANKVAVEYTLEDLKRDFPNKWKDIVKAEQWFRRQYDEYVERINVSLEKVYPKVEEKARVDLAKLKANAQYNAEQAKASEETVQQLEWKIGKERSKRSGGKKGKLLRWERKLAEAKKAAERYREKQTRCQDAAVKLQKDIDSGEILRNKRLTPRKDYFHHMQESREGWGRLIDILTAPENISSDLSGQSEFTKPNAKFAGFMQRRTGDLAKQDAVEGFLHYIEAAEYKIAFDPFVAEGRRQIKSMAEQTANTRNANKFLVWYTDYLNGIAGKTNPFDRWMSKAFDRKSVEALKWLNSRVKANAIMGNVRSALAQFFNLQNGALYMPNPAHWAKGAKLLAEQIVGKSDAKMLFDRSVFLNERFLDNKMWRFDESIMKNPNRFANWMMSAGDELSAKLIWATAYEKAAAAKMTDPIEYADDITMRSVGGRGVGDVPLTQSSEVVKLIAPFQLEVNNSWQAMKENFKAKNGAGFVAMAVVSFAMNEALRQTLGYDVSFDMINALIEGIKGWDDEEEKWDNLMNVFGRLTGEIVSNIPMGAQIAQLLWSDEASRERFLGDADPTRFGTGNIGLDMVTSVVTEMVAGNNFADDLLSATLNLVLPWGGKQTEKIVEALQDFGVLPRVSASMRDGISVDKQAEPGSYSQSGRLRFPIEATAGNVMRDLLFGPYSTKQGIEFSESGEFALSEDLTAAWEALTELGMDGVEAYDAIRESRGFTADKDETGKSIAGSKKNKVLEYINGLNITEEQKDILLASAGYDEEKEAEAAPWNNDMENDEFRVWADLTTWEQEDYEEFVEGAGMSLNDYAAFCEATRDMTADKDENGKSISGTKKKKIVDYIQSLDIPAEQKDALFFAAGYKESTLDETPWHDGEEAEAKKKKSGKRGGRRRTGREKALSIKSIAEDLGLEDAIRGVPSPGKSAEYASAYADIQKVTDRLQEKNPWYALPTGNPELDEERPAAARYFATGKL